MKNFLKIASLFATLCLVSPAAAQDTPTPPVVNGQTIDCNNIKIADFNSTQISYIQSICKGSASTEKVTPEKVREWASLGKEFSTAVVDTAKGLGMAANEFLFTPVGILIAFYFLWDMIGGIIIGSLLLAGIWFLYFYIIGKLEKHDIEYENVPVLWGMFSIKKVKSVQFYDLENIFWVRTLMTLPAFFISGIIIGTLIF